MQFLFQISKLLMVPYLRIKVLQTNYTHEKCRCQHKIKMQFLFQISKLLKVPFRTCASKCYRRTHRLAQMAQQLNNRSRSATSLLRYDATNRCLRWSLGSRRCTCLSLPQTLSLFPRRPARLAAFCNTWSTAFEQHRVNGPAPWQVSAAPTPVHNACFLP